MESIGNSRSLGFGLLFNAVFVWSWVRARRPTTKHAPAIEGGQFNEKESASSPRDLVSTMQSRQKQCIVFYGTETGTAEAYAKKLGPEIQARFSLQTMVADLDDYDMENLSRVPSHILVVFILATAGDGEPTSNNTGEFFNMITDDDGPLSDLATLRFAAFGLKNHTYEHYNAVVRRVTAALMERGATLVGSRGEGDDGAGTLQEDFKEWKRNLWMSMTSDMGLEEAEFSYVPAYSTIEHTDMTSRSDEVYLGELTHSLLHGASPQGPTSRNNPHFGHVSVAKELFKKPHRNCVHLEFDISGCGQTYTTGDHVGIWPSNADDDVDALLHILGLTEKRNCVVSFKGSLNTPFLTPSNPSTSKSPRFGCRLMLLLPSSWSGPAVASHHSEVLFFTMQLWREAGYRLVR